MAYRTETWVSVPCPLVLVMTVSHVAASVLGPFLNGFQSVLTHFLDSELELPCEFGIGGFSDQ